jgi:hypothetical protein
MKLQRTFNFITKDGREHTFHFGRYERPNSTKAWKLVSEALDRNFVRSAGYDTTDWKPIDRGLRFKLGKALINDMVEDIFFIPNDKESAIIYKYQLNKKLNR